MISISSGEVYSAASFVGLLLYYPRRLAPRWVGLAIVALFIGWWVAQNRGVFESMTFARRFLVMIAVFVTFVLAAIHWFRTKRDRVARAALQWFLLSWVIGTGLFAVVILLPQLFGFDTSWLQGYAFLLFILVYVGLAFGILRYRLFELGDWWRAILGWGVALFFVLGSYFGMVVGLNLQTGLALALALLFGAAASLISRSVFRERKKGRFNGRREELFSEVLRIGLGPEEEQNQRWIEHLKALFEPLEIIHLDRVETTEISSDGSLLFIPSVGICGPMSLAHPGKGGRLFSKADLALAKESHRILVHTLENRVPYEQGVTAERSRIAQDIHDNIASQLFDALKSPELDRKDQKIRETMAEIREMIRCSSDSVLTLEESMGELRIETYERADAADLKLEWNCQGIASEQIAPGLRHALRSIIREAVSNVIKHANASVLKVSLGLDADALRLSIEDNGCGFDTGNQGCRKGEGLVNFERRLAAFAGSVEIQSNEEGTSVCGIIPLSEKTFV